MLQAMFVVTEAEAAAIRAVYEQRGEFSAAVELRRLFPGVTDNAQAQECARTIAGWKPMSLHGERCRSGRGYAGPCAPGAEARRSPGSVALRISSASGLPTGREFRPPEWPEAALRRLPPSRKARPVCSSGDVLR